MPSLVVGVGADAVAVGRAGVGASRKFCMIWPLDVGAVADEVVGAGCMYGCCAVVAVVDRVAAGVRTGASGYGAAWLEDDADVDCCPWCWLVAGPDVG